LDTYGRFLFFTWKFQYCNLDDGNSSYDIRSNFGGGIVKFLVHALFIILILLVTFFGLGPVIYADGVIQERIWTATIVVAIYALLAILYSRVIKWMKKK
jgi:hypothetical protein